MEGHDAPRSATPPSASDDAEHARQTTPSETDEGFARRVARRVRGTTFFVSELLLIVALAFGVAADLVYPGDQSTAAEGGLTNFDLTLPSVPDGIYLSLSKARAGTAVDFFVTRLSPKYARGGLAIAVPRDAWGGTRRCLRTAIACELGANSKFVEFALSRPVPASHELASLPGQRVFRERVHVTIPGVTYNAATTDETAAITLPDVIDHLTASEHLPIPPEVSISIAVPNGSRYAWTSGPLPHITGETAHWLFTSRLASAVEVNGVSVAAESADTRKTFISGALLGVAGGALVGAVQEALNALRSRSRRRPTVGGDRA